MKQIIIVLFISMPIYLYGQVEETEPNDYGESGIITLDFDIDNTGASYIPPCVGEDCDPVLPFERDVWYVPVGISGERTITYTGTNTAWFEMYTSDSNYTPNSGVKVVESLVNDTALVFEFIDSSFYFIEITGSPDSSNIYSFSVSSELPKPYISADSPLYIGSTNEEPDSSAILELESTTKGFLPPRMTEEEILAINTPADGLIVYCTSNSTIYVYKLPENKWSSLSYLYVEDIILPANFTIGDGLGCDSLLTSGTYHEDVYLNSLNHVQMEVSVSAIGTWNISTPIVNGYGFSGNGNFTTTGMHQITLLGSGTPISEQTDNFIVSSENGNAGSCNFDIDVNEAPSCVSSTVTYDGQTYSTVLIGTQCWFAENLNVGTMLTIDSLQMDNAIIEKHCYDDDSTNCDLYGGLYSWNEMMQYVTTDSAQGICPTGWHLPSFNEYNTLLIHLGVPYQQLNIGYPEGTNEGSKMAAVDSLWIEGSLVLNSEFGASGFNALPAGRLTTVCCDGELEYQYVSERAYLMSSSYSYYGDYIPKLKFLMWQLSNIQNENSKFISASVRCISN